MCNIRKHIQYVTHRVLQHEISNQINSRCTNENIKCLPRCGEEYRASHKVYCGHIQALVNQNVNTRDSGCGGRTNTTVGVCQPCSRITRGCDSDLTAVFVLPPQPESWDLPGVPVPLLYATCSFTNFKTEKLRSLTQDVAGSVKTSAVTDWHIDEMSVCRSHE